MSHRYKILRSDESISWRDPITIADHFEYQVTKYINQGWIPCGNVGYDDKTRTYVQSLWLPFDAEDIISKVEEITLK